MEGALSGAERSRSAPDASELAPRSLRGDADRDSTALTIVEIDLTPLTDDLIHDPRYLVVHRRLWTGESQPSLYAQIKALAELWDPHRIVIDATGIGAGLASFLAKAFPSQVLPFVFTAKSKSDLGWSFLSVIETGRFKDYLPSPRNGRSLPRALSGGVGGGDDLKSIFFLQCQHTQMEILPGPAKTLRWSVPDETRDLATGDPIHDDLVISAALCALLDDQPWGRAESAIIQPYDPLSDMQF